MTETTTVDVPDPMQEAVARIGRHWGLLLTYAILTFALGVVVLVWPQETVKVVMLLLAIQLFIGGVFYVVQAIATDEASGGQRALLGLLGALSLMVALLVLRKPLQTLALITVIIGAWWVIGGVVTIVTSFGRDVAYRGWRILSGVVSVAAGAFLLLQPDVTLKLLVWVIGLWLVISGAILVAAAFAVRSAGRQAESALGARPL